MGLWIAWIFFKQKNKRCGISTCFVEIIRLSVGDKYHTRVKLARQQVMLKSIDMP